MYKIKSSDGKLTVFGANHPKTGTVITDQDQAELAKMHKNGHAHLIEIVDEEEGETSEPREPAKTGRPKKA